MLAIPRFEELANPFQNRLISMYAQEPQVGLGGVKRPITTKSAIPHVSGMVLYELIRGNRIDCTCEVGLSYGFSTLFMLAGLAAVNGREHTAIDPHQAKLWDDVGRAHMARVDLESGLSCRFLPEPSERALIDLQRTKSRFGLLFIDGDHLFEPVLLDFYLCAKLCRVGGYIVLDDTWMGSVQTVANFIRQNRADFHEVMTPASNLLVFQRVGQDTRPWHDFEPFMPGKNKDA